MCVFELREEEGKPPGDPAAAAISFHDEWMQMQMEMIGLVIGVKCKFKVKVNGLASQSAAFFPFSQWIDGLWTNKEMKIEIVDADAAAAAELS